MLALRSTLGLPGLPWRVNLFPSHSEVRPHPRGRGALGAIPSKGWAGSQSSGAAQIMSQQSLCLGCLSSPPSSSLWHGDKTLVHCVCAGNGFRTTRK